MTMLAAYALLAAAILCGVVGQLLLKQGASAPDLLAQFLKLHTIIGLGFYGVAALLYIIAKGNTHNCSLLIVLLKFRVWQFHFGHCVTNSLCSLMRAFDIFQIEHRIR